MLFYFGTLRNIIPNNNSQFKHSYIKNGNLAGKQFPHMKMQQQHLQPRRGTTNGFPLFFLKILLLTLLLIAVNILNILLIKKYRVFLNSYIILFLTFDYSCFLYNTLNIPAKQGRTLGTHLVSKKSDQSRFRDY